MPDVTPSTLLLEPGAPLWAQRLALRLVRTFVNLFPTAPVRLWKITEAGLPNPADWTGATVFVTDLGKPAWSNGAAWVDATGAPI